MKVHLGPVTLEIVQVDSEVELRIRAPGYVTRRNESPPATLTKATKQEYASQPQEDDEAVRLLFDAGFTRQSLAMVINKVLNVPITGPTLLTKFHFAEEEAKQFLTRPISKDIWALFVAPVELTNNVKMNAALGLSSKNQLTILAMNDDPPQKLFSDLVRRGLKPETLKFAIVSVHTGALADFKKTFPKTQLGMDWAEYADMSRNPAVAQMIRDGMMIDDEDSVRKIVAKAKGPKELLTFLSYNKSLWRALRTTAPIARVNKDLRNKLKAAGAHSEEQRQLVTAFALARLQYHWSKIPVDAPQLKNLKYIQSSNVGDDDEYL